MIIFRNLQRSFFKNKMYVFAIITLITFTGFIFSLLTHSIIPLTEHYEYNKIANHVEQFHFYPNITSQITDSPNNDKTNDKTSTEITLVQHLASQYQFSYEKYQSKYIKQNNTFFIATDYTGSINTPHFVKGHQPIENTEIALSIGYANAHQLTPDMTIQILEQSYTITGIFYDPGNTFIYHPSFSETVFAKDNTKVIFSQSAYRALSANETQTYLGTFNNTAESDTPAKIEKLLQDPQFAYVEESGDNVKLFDSTLQSQKSIMYIGSIIIATITFIFIFLFINNHLNEIRKQYGLMLSMGYHPKQLLTPYATTPLISSFFIIIGIALGIIFQDILTAQMTEIFSYPITSHTINFQAITSFTLCYTVFITSIFIYKVNSILRTEPKYLIFGRKKANRDRNTFFMNSTKFVKHLPFKQHIQFKFITAHFSKVITLFMVSTLSTTLLLIALALNSAFTQTITSLETQTSYDKIVTFNTIKQNDVLLQKQTQFLTVPAFFIHNLKEATREKVTAQFIDFDTAPLKFSKDTAQTSGGIILPYKYKHLRGYKINDIVEIEINTKKTPQKIIGFSELSESKTIFLPYTMITQYDDRLNTSSYNNLYLHDPQQSPPDDATLVTKKQTQIQLMQDLKQNGSTLITILILFSTLTAFALIRILTAITIKKNAKGIIILLISGYKEKDIAKLMLNIYSIFILCGTLLSVVITPIILDAFTKAVNTSGNLFILIKMTTLDFIIAALLVLFIYLCTIRLERRKIDKLNIRKILDNE